ncbi:MAG: PAS domain-containing protein [Spirochaetes bacterium]|nr:PAS domain-containing protein [Spirochaetota bacterium]MBN2770101.1 PAS domain-containing protein [Spirochaetota bacterium]
MNFDIRACFDNIKSAVFVCDKDFSVLYRNMAAENLSNRKNAKNSSFLCDYTTKKFVTEIAKNCKDNSDSAVFETSIRNRVYSVTVDIAEDNANISKDSSALYIIKMTPQTGQHEHNSSDNYTNTAFDSGASCTDARRRGSRCAEFELITGLAGIGYWEYNCKTGEAFVSDILLQLAGAPFSARDNLADYWTSHLHPDDRSRVFTGFKSALNGKSDLLFLEYRIFNENIQRWSWMSAMGKVLKRDSDNMPLKLAGYQKDISERKNFEKQLKKNSDYLNLIMETTDVGYVVATLDGRILQYNNALLKVLNRTREEIETGSYYRFLTESSRQDVKNSFRKYIETGENTSAYEIEIYAPDGTIINCLVNPTPVQDETGDYLGSFAWLTDITGFKTITRNLRETGNKLNIALQSAGLGMYQIDLSSGNVWWDKRMYEIYDRDPAEFTPTIDTIVDLVVPEDRDYENSIFFHTLQESTDWHQQYRIMDRNGNFKYIEGYGTIIENSDGVPQKVIGVASDMTEKRLSERQKIKNSQQQLIIFDNSPLGMVFIDRNGFVLQSNSNFEKIFNVSFDQVDIEKIDKLNNEQFSNFVKRAREGEEIETEIELDSDNKKVILHLILKPVLPGGRSDVIGILEDITVRKTAESRLKAAMLQAEEANRSKSAFLANMSHEIRTPMNAVIGLTYLLKQTNMTTRQMDYASKIESASNNLLALINDILDFSKIEAGKIVVEQIPYSIHSIIEDIRTIVQFNADQKRLSLDISVEDSVPHTVIGDPVRVHQIVLNLLNNAIKFTDHGKVTLTVTGVQPNLKRKRITIIYRVTDTGIGMSKEQQRHIFESFTQADSTTTRNYGGTGLGLAICKGLVMTMNGTISIKSRPGRGSTFTVSIPCSVSDTSIEQSGSKSCNVVDESDVECPLQGLRLLLVEDNSINQQVASELLEKEGIDVTVAQNGKKAIEAMEIKGWDCFDLILMDLQMPVMDGYEATKKIVTKTKTPIVAMSADVVHGVRERVKSAGMCDYIAKPINVSQLYRVIAAYTRRKPVLTQSKMKEQSPMPQVKRQTGINSENALNNLNGNIELYCSLLESFLGSMIRYPVQAEGMLYEGKVNDALRLIHTMKGVAVNLGLEGLEPLCMDAQSRIKQTGVLSEDTKKSLDQITKYMESISTSIGQFISNNRRTIKTSKPLAKFSDFLTTMDELIILMKVYDGEAVDCVKNLELMNLPENIKKEVDELGSLVLKFDFEKALEHAVKITEKYKNGFGA